MILEKAIPFTLEIPMVGGLNEDDDPTTIGDGEFQMCNKVLLDHKVSEKFPEFTKLNPSNKLESGADVDGVTRCYADDGTARLIAVCNGKVYESSDWATPIYSGLTAGKPCKFIPYRGQVLITNGYDYPVLYDPKTNTLGGSSHIESPQQIKRIAYFETDESGWTGGTVDLESHVDTEWEGDSLQGRKLTAAASATETMERGSLSLDLSTHPDGSSVSGYDYVDVSIYHRILAHISTLTVYLETSGGNYYSFSLPATSLDPEEQRDYQWTHLKIVRDRFISTGAPNWNSITKVKLGVTATAVGTADPTFDNIRLRRSPAIAGDMRKEIATFEPSQETWVGGAYDRVNYKEDSYGGGVGLKLTLPNGSAYCDKTIDLSKYVDGGSIAVADKMSVWVYINDVSKVTDLKIACGDATMANRQEYLFTVAAEEIKLINNGWQELSIPIDDFTEVGAHNWEDTVRIQVVGTIAAGGEVTFDHWVCLYTDSMLQISAVDWNTSGETFAESNSKWSARFKATGDSSVESTLPAFYPYFLSWFSLTFGTVKNLAQWGDGIASVDDDKISFWSFAAPESSPYALRNIIISIDCNNGDFATDYYSYAFSALNHDFYLWYPGTERVFSRRKGDFTRVGTTGGKDWSTIKAVKIEYIPWGSIGKDIPFYTDDIKMSRENDWKGQFQWKVVNLFGNTRSPASEASNFAEISRERALLTNIPISNDSRVKERELYRKEIGGEDFLFSTKIPNNTSTKWVDEIYETGLTMSEMGVPEGNILPPKGVTGLEYKERILLFQDLADLNSIAFTDPYLIYSWVSARLMPSEVVAGVVHFDNLFLFMRDGRVYRTNEDIDVAVFQPLGEMLKCVSPWGMCKVGDQGIGVVTEDDIKIFNGYESASVGKAIKPYLKQEDYKTEESVLFYHKDHLYYRVETRAGGSHKQFDCYVPDVKWEASDKEPFKSFCSYTGRGDKNEMVCGGFDGYVYKLDTTYDDSLAVRSKDFSEVNTSMGKGFAFHEKEIHELRVIAKGQSSGGPLTLKVYVNGVDTGVAIDIPSSNGDLNTFYHTYVVQLAGVNEGVSLVGQTIGFGLYHGTVLLGNKDKNVWIKAVMISGEVKPLEEQYSLP